MKSSYIRGREGGGVLKVLGMACLLIYLDCGGVAGLRGSLFDYVSFEDTGEWDHAYRQTCRGMSHDDFREPRHVQFPDTLSPPYESKTPVTIITNETLRRNDSRSNFTLHIYANTGLPRIYSLSYGFQRNKECIHGQDADCIVQRSFGGVRALVLNAERFKPGQSLNFIKDHYQVEGPERHVTILNGGSLNERKFYEAAFLGGYIPKALQSRGKSSHVIDGKSYPMEIYMYFVDETVPSMSLTTILVVLVEESEKDNVFVAPIVNTVNKKLYDEERKFMHNNELLLRRELQFHNQDPSIKYDVFADRKKKKRREEQIIRQERLKASAKLNQDLADQLEIFEKMQALDSQLFFIDEDAKNAQASFDRSRSFVEDFEYQVPKSLDFPYDSDELHIIGQLAIYFGAVEVRQRIYGNLKVLNILSYVKNRTDLLTYAEWDHGTIGGRGLFIRLVHLGSDNSNYLYKRLFDANILTEAERDRLALIHFEQFKNLSFNVLHHGQKHMNWIDRNRDESFMKSISSTVKYQLVKEYRDLLEERKLLNEDMYNHFFGSGSLHQRAAREWGWTDKHIIPDFQYTITPEERKRTIVDSILLFLETHYRTEDYRAFLAKTNLGIIDLAKANKFPDGETMREVLHHQKFGYKDFGKRGRRNYARDSFFKYRLPYQQKRQGPVDLGNMEMTKKDNEEEANLSPPKTIVNGSFQISWLIPPNGGYYYYSGSSPVPPCYRAQNVIVFKKPIHMSRFQIETLTRVPIAFNKNLDIVHTTPVLHDTKFMVKLRTSTSDDIRYEDVSVPVYFQPRNHLFLGHDGVHKNSVEAFEKRQRERQSQALLSESDRVMMGQSTTLWILIIGLAFVY